MLSWLIHHIADDMAGRREANGTRQSGCRNLERRGILSQTTHDFPNDNEANPEDSQGQQNEQNRALH